MYLFVLIPYPLRLKFIHITTFSKIMNKKYKDLKTYGRIVGLVVLFHSTRIKFWPWEFSFKRKRIKIGRNNYIRNQSHTVAALQRNSYVIPYKSINMFTLWMLVKDWIRFSPPNLCHVCLYSVHAILSVDYMSVCMLCV